MKREQGPTPHESKMWRGKKRKLREQSLEAQERSPLLHLLGFADLGSRVQAIFRFNIPTLVRPQGGNILVAGPCEVGVLYEERWLYAPPTPWEPMTVMQPAEAFLPNLHPGGGLCLGQPPAGIDMEQLLHLGYAALTLNSANPIEWEGLNPEAAEFVRARHDQWPIVETGLFEEPPTHRWPGIEVCGDREIPPFRLLPRKVKSAS